MNEEYSIIKTGSILLKIRMFYKLTKNYGAFNMLLISQNIKNHYNLEFPDDVILRINLAWCNSLEELKEKLSNEKNS